MDPATTLFTFMLQTAPWVQFVHLVGSWDNFSTYRLMERDMRRGHGQWRGCYSFQSTICEEDGGSGAASAKSGGLRMGSKYYYYYELDGSREVHDPSQPSTSTCPYLPGQQVNTLSIPVERSLRKRSASLTSMRASDFRTMNPEDKFVSPRPAPPVPFEGGIGGGSGCRHARVGSSPAPSPAVCPSPGIGSPVTAARPVSPAPSWRRFLGFRGRSSTTAAATTPTTATPTRTATSVMMMMMTMMPDQHRPATPASFDADCRSVASETSSRTRDISPESLRRLLADDLPTPPADERAAVLALPSPPRPMLIIPDDMAEDHDDDNDDNFATSAVSDINFFGTSLSPPPPQSKAGRGPTRSAFWLSPSDAGRSLKPAAPLPSLGGFRFNHDDEAGPGRVRARAAFSLPKIITSGGPRSHFSLSTIASSTVASPTSPRSPGSFPDSVDHDDGDDDDGREEEEEEGEAFTYHRRQPISPASVPARNSTEQRYWLPEVEGGEKQTPQVAAAAAASLARGGPPVLDVEIGSRADGFAAEMGWIVDSAGGS